MFIHIVNRIMNWNLVRNNNEKPCYPFHNFENFVVFKLDKIVNILVEYKLHNTTRVTVCPSVCLFV